MHYLERRFRVDLLFHLHHDGSRDDGNNDGLEWVLSVADPLALIVDAEDEALGSGGGGLELAAEGNEDSLLEAGELHEQRPFAAPFDLPLDRGEKDDARGWPGDGGGGIFVEERDLPDVIPFFPPQLGRDEVRLFGQEIGRASCRERV